VPKLEAKQRRSLQEFHTTLGALKMPTIPPRALLEVFMIYACSCARLPIEHSTNLSAASKAKGLWAVKVKGGCQM
jgi:hypothetical protein